MSDTTPGNAFELQNVSERADESRVSDFAPHGDVVGDEVTAQSLPPYDGGKVAWRLLLAMFVFEALLWGELHILR